MDNLGIRNLDQIQEQNGRGSGSRLGTLVMASAAGACVVFAAIALMRRPAPQKPIRADPLSELSNKGTPAASAHVRPGLSDREIAFPDLLSDDPHPTTAMAAIPIGSSSSAFQAVASAPPPAADRLPVVPLPAQNYLSLGPVVTEPRDALTAAAHQASTPNGPEANEGAPGGYQLQVSSFRLQEEAQKFTTALRKRGHRAHYEAALVPGKGTWYRVRIGPFKTKLETMHYRRDFEQREHMVPFLVEPQDKLPSAVARKNKAARNPD